MNEPVPILLDSDEPVLPRTPSFLQVNPELRGLAAGWLSAPNATGAAIAHLLAGDADHMICVVSCGTGAPPVGTILDVNVGITGRCIRENRAFRSYDTRLDPRVDLEACESLDIRSLVIAPVCRDSQCIGILEVFSDKPAAFGEEALATLERDAVLAAALIDGEVESNEVKPGEMSCEPDRISPSNAGFAAVISGRLDAPEEGNCEPSHSVANPEPRSIDAPQFLRSYTESNRHALPWIALAAVTICVGFSVPKLIRRIQSVEAASSGDVQSRSINKRPTATLAAPTVVIPVKDPLEPDSASVVRSLAKEAESGDVAAQVLLANRYANGDGVGVNNVRATAWYIVAGANGDRQAKSAAVHMSHELSQFEIAQVRFNVATMYRDGIGSPPDVIAAYSWFVLAGAAGDVRAKGEQQRLEQRMRPVQLSEARRRAAEWISSHHSPRSRADKIVAAATQ